MRYSHTTNGSKAQYYRALREQKLEGKTLSANTEVMPEIRLPAKVEAVVGKPIEQYKARQRYRGHPIQFGKEHTAKELAIMAGLIPGPDEIADSMEEEGRYLDDWFLSMGMYDPRKDAEDLGHPLEVVHNAALAADELEQDQFMERTRKEQQNQFKEKSLWRDMKIDRETLNIIPREDMREYNDIPQGALGPLQIIDMNAAGFFKWEWNGTPRSSFDFADNQIRTKRQIAGFIGGLIKNKDIDIVQSGWIGDGESKTPVYRVCISEKLPNTFLMAENAYASSLKRVDTQGLERFARAQKRTERALSKFQQRLKDLRKHSLDKEPIELAKQACAKLYVRLKARRREYSVLVGKAYEEAEFDVEPDLKAWSDIEEGNDDGDYTYNGWDYIAIFEGAKRNLCCDPRELEETEEALEDLMQSDEMAVHMTLGQKLRNASTGEDFD